MKNLRSVIRNPRGFTLVEMAVALIVFAIIGLAIYGVMVRTSQASRLGSTVAEAQQNARAALDTILRDLREMGYGLGGLNQVPVETASEYRVTFVADRDGDGLIGPGERVTYFVDNNASDPIVVNTPNPNDYVLRRVVSDAVDLLATPGSGKGQVVAYGITQRTRGNATWDVPLFTYFSGIGTSLVGGGVDPDGSQYGYTVADSLLGKPAGTGATNAVRTVKVEIVAEASYRDSETNDYRQVRISGTIRPRNFGLTAWGAAGVSTPPPPPPPPPPVPPAPPDTTSPPDTTAPPPQELPPVEPPVYITAERILSLNLVDIHERDSGTQENSLVTADHQHDWDILIGAKSANGKKDIGVWYAAIPDRYSSESIYTANPGYVGFSGRDIYAVATGNVNASLPQFPDAVMAVSLLGSETQGGFEVWMNKQMTDVNADGRLDDREDFYSNLSGKGQAIALADFDLDGDLDVVLGTRTGTSTGAIEIWSNDGLGIFTFGNAFSASGEVNALAVADFDGDGYPDIAAGTRTLSKSDGSIEVWSNYGPDFNFIQVGTWTASGKVNAMAAGTMNDDDDVDLVLGVRTGNGKGRVELWLNDGWGYMAWADEAIADGEVLSLALGQIDYGNSSLDIVAGTDKRVVHSWFCDPLAALPSDIIPSSASWSDANAGGKVATVAIAKVETSRDTPEYDPLNDIVVGTAITNTTGAIVIYLNPYVWTLPTP